MDSHKHCPTCDTTHTQAMNTEYHASTIDRVRQCMEPDCGTQYVVEYGRPEITEVTDL